MGAANPEVPEPALSRRERKAERQRLRSVRKERRRAKLHGKKSHMEAKKDRKKS